MTKHLAKLVLAVTFTGIVGCGGASKTSQPEEKKSGPVLTLDTSTAGDIKGTVTLAGTPPAMPPVDMKAVPPCQKLNASQTSPVVVAGNQGQLANVVIYLKSGLANYQFTPPGEPVMLNQKDCMYDRRVVALMTGQPLEVANSDPVLHNVRAVLKHNKPFSYTEATGGTPIMTSFAQPEFAAHLLCNVHPWMRSILFVFDNPYFAVTSTVGTFELKDVPPGTYAVEAWQEKFGALDQTVTIGPKESKTISFEFKSGS